MYRKTQKKTNKKKVGRVATRVDERILPKKSELEHLPLKWQIFKIKVKSPTISNVQVAEILQCDESLVRRHLKGDLADEIKKVFNQQYINHFLHLQPKAFKRLEEALDNPCTEIKDIIAICRYILDRVKPDEKEDPNSPTELIFETFITETGTVKRIENKVYEKKQELERDEKWETIQVYPEYNDGNE